MYLDSKSITALWHFIYGYQGAKSEMLKPEERTKTSPFPLDFWYFHEFVKVKLGAYSSVPGWRNIILEECGGDEAKGLEMFFSLYDEFERIRPTRYWKAVLTAENIAYNNDCQHCYRMTGENHTKKEPIFDKPLAAYITELDLTGKTAYLLVVETENSVKDEKEFFRTFEEAAHGWGVHSGAQTYFGKIDNWQEINELTEFYY